MQISNKAETEETISRMEFELGRWLWNSQKEKKKGAVTTSLNLWYGRFS